MSEVTETSAVSAPEDALLSCDGISKSFGSVQALTEASLWARRGEITALVGDNGAGKSTLVRCMAGIHPPDAGQVTFRGDMVRFHSPEDARSAGIETVHQSLALVDELAVWQNMFLNRERLRRLGPVALLDRRRMQRESRHMLSRLDVDLPSVASRVRRLSGGQRQAVAICRAASWGSDLIIMDEPTAALGVRESAKVEDLIHLLRDEGVGILLISHNFNQVMRLSDHVWVMRAGRVAGERRTAETSGDELVSLITGASFDT